MRDQQIYMLDSEIKKHPGRRLWWTTFIPLPNYLNIFMWSAGTVLGYNRIYIFSPASFLDLLLSTKGAATEANPCICRGNRTMDRPQFVSELKILAFSPVPLPTHNHYLLACTCKFVPSIWTVKYTRLHDSSYFRLSFKSAF